GVGHIHAAELAPPQVERRVTETVLAAQLLDRRAGGRLLQEADDLFFGVSLLHVRPLVRRTLLRSDWPGYRGAGHYYRAFKDLGDTLPALIPQVYLHYDPYTLAQLGGVGRLPRQRMDFLLLFS